MILILSLIGMICWGIAPIFVKIGLNNISSTLGLMIRTVFTAGLLLGWTILDGTITRVKETSYITIGLLIVEAILATFIGDLAYFTAVKNGSVSLVTIIMSASPLVTVICSVIFLGEQFTLYKFIGSFLVISGIVLLLKT